MLTPIFVCEQDESFVIVSITLSALCKVTTAIFSILGQQFTFHCAPYYLRLKFDQCIAEGRNERATYAVETNVLTVYVPKEHRGELFTQLDNPAYLIATEKERQQLVQLVGGSEAQREDPAPLDEEETEFRQQLFSARGPAEGCGDYGFAGTFSGLFASVDPGIAAEVLDLPRNPEETTVAERRQLRLQSEDHAFDEDALLLSFEDAEGEVKRLLQYVPQHRADYVAALDAEGIRYMVPSAAMRGNATTATAAAAAAANGDHDRGVLEEEDVVLPISTGVVDVWAGNIGDFKRPLVEEVPPPVLADVDVPMEASRATVAAPPAGSLATPQQRPRVSFSLDEQAVLMNIKAPRLLFPPAAQVVDALTADILFSEAYDDIVTEGTGCSESLWNVCKLSPALSWLDPAENVYDACVFFARRALIYPLHRNFALIQRVFSSVGVRLLLGKSYVIKALLRVRAILAHAEHRHVLVTLFLNPLLGYWMGVQDADERLLRLALELHAHVTRVEPEMEVAAPTSSLLVQRKRRLLPLSLLNLGLPFS
ncbi:protein SHQ1 [Trypanosoma conorhini]|uniref:Protein SHQ1 n=1 Tax=Trypanosoma conorhini TaxID=83891 RepID=A0A422QC22_9TRYP|nr:protein SHQ1 [Trypanosoma conorhini]RNF27533.1 protein SHQ1 [Trypanosoma conorhini]